MGPILRPGASRCCRTGSGFRSATTGGPARWWSGTPVTRPHGIVGSEDGHVAALGRRWTSSWRSASWSGSARDLGGRVTTSTRPMPRLRIRALERLVGARHPGVRVPAARPIPREELRHEHLGLGRADRRGAAVPRAGPCQTRRRAVPSRPQPWSLDLRLEAGCRDDGDRSRARHLYLVPPSSWPTSAATGRRRPPGDLLGRHGERSRAVLRQLDGAHVAGPGPVELADGTAERSSTTAIRSCCGAGRGPGDPPRSVESAMCRHRGARHATIARAAPWRTTAQSGIFPANGMSCSTPPTETTGTSTRS